MTTKIKPAASSSLSRVRLLLQGLAGTGGMLSHHMGSRGINRWLKGQGQRIEVVETVRQSILAEWTSLLTASSAPEESPAVTGLSVEEQAVVDRIKLLTRQSNRNNVTRTAAYWTIYTENPELHWAFLAHMVSRNGGWNMTDLQGELVPRLLGRRMRSAIFAMLERANGLIFQDAYPQLLLYAESKRLGRSLFHLLALFHISDFMKPVWRRFFQEGDSVLLTLCLIINEQQYIEGRVVHHPYYRREVLDSWTFRVQPLSQLNQVVFPYREVRPAGGDVSNAPLHSSRPDKALPAMRLAGLTLENFSDLHERICFGKALYAILFGIPAVRQGAADFAAATPHTGSRQDYWPGLYTAAPQAPLPLTYSEKLDGFSLVEGAGAFYSPALADAWADQPPAEAERYDWFKRPGDIREEWLTAVSPGTADMTAEVGLGLHKQELAVLAAQLVGLKPR